MADRQKIAFRVARDTTQVYNTAFRFVRQNRSVLFQSVTLYIMPFVLVAAILIFSASAGLVTTFYGGVKDNWLSIGFSVLQLFFGVLVGYVAYATYITLVYEYMRLYHEAENPFSITHRDVWKATRKRFFVGFAHVLVWGVLVGALTGAVFVIFYIFLILGALLSIALSSPWLIAVLYLLLYLVEFSLILYIQVFSFPMLFLSAFERMDIFTAFGRSFSMVNRRQNFWNAVGVTFLGGLIMYILRYITLFPLGLLAGVFAYFSLSPQDLIPGGIWFNVLFKVVLPFLTLVYFYTFIFYFVAEAFEATSLDERVRAPGLMAKVEKMGTYRDRGPEFYEASY
jgi:hypothetical protein